MIRNVWASAPLHRIAAGLATVVVLAGCSLAPFGDDDDDDDAAAGGQPGVVALGGEAGAGAAPSSAPAGRQAFAVDKTAWYAGLKMTFGEAVYDPQAERELTVQVLVENLSERDFRPHLPVLFSAGGQQFEGSFRQDSLVGSKQQGRLDLEFRVSELTGPLTGGEFILGRGTEAQSRVPLGAGELVANEPRNVLHAGKKIVHRDLNVWFKTCDVRADLAPMMEQVDTGHTALACFVDVQYTGGDRAGHYWGDEHLRLKLPDGTVVGPTKGPNEALYSSDIVPDTYVAFMIRWPAPGSYELQVVDRHAGEGSSKKVTRGVPVTL